MMCSHQEISPSNSPQMKSPSTAFPYKDFKHQSSLSSITTSNSLQSNNLPTSEYCPINATNLSMYFNTSHFNYLLSKCSEVIDMNKTINYISKETLCALSKRKPKTIINTENISPTRNKDSNGEVKSRKGWVCLNCINFNYEKRKVCNKCNQPKTIVSSGQIQYRTIERKEDVKESKMKTDWKCAKCFNLNYSFRNECNCCNISRRISETIRQNQAQAAMLYMNYYCSLIPVSSAWSDCIKTFYSLEYMSK